jgi:hypothetical protein
MPRLVTNNPTERILRLLDDFEQIEAALDTVLQMVATADHELFLKLPAKPFCEAIIEERLRQQLTSGRTRAKRQVMQRLRANPESRSRREHTRPNAWSKGGQPELEQAFETLLPQSLSPEQLEALAREMNQESIQPEDLADLQLETKKP